MRNLPVLDIAEKLVYAVLAIAAVFAVFALLSKLSGGGMVEKDGETVLRYDAGFRAIGLMAILAALITVVVFVVARLNGGAQEPGAEISIGIVVGLFLVLGLWLVIETYRRRIVISEEGIAARGWFGPAGALGWDEIESVERRDRSQKFVVRGGRTKISIGYSLDGVGVFVLKCRERLNPEVYGEAFSEQPPARPFM